MKKSYPALLIFFLLLAFRIYAQQNVISVSDFKVESDNPSHVYIGKGLSRLVAGELRKSDSIQIIEREQINKIIEEQKLALSGLVEESGQMEIGRLASAQLIVLGEIINMGDKVLISMRMADVSTGKIVWQEELTEKLSKYDYISAYFAKSIMKNLGRDADKTTEKKLTVQKEKPEQTIVKISAGIAAYDKGDKEKAKKELELAKKLDPESEVVSYYLSKLIINTTRFEIVCEPFYSYQNPAYLGTMKTDRLLFSSSFGGMIGGFQSISDESEYRELDGRLNLGYYFPVKENMGIGVDLFLSVIRNDAKGKNDNDDSVWSSRFFQGGIFSTGVKVNERIALGAGVSIFKVQNYNDIMSPPKDDFDKLDEIAFAGNAGLLFTINPDLSYDCRAGLNNADAEVINPETFTVEDTVYFPLYIEQTLTIALKERKMFAILKQMNDIAWDRSFYYGRILPAIEISLTDFLLLRSGIEGSYISTGNDRDFGYGIMGGTTLRIIKWGLDIDINITYRQRPARSLENFLMTDIPFLVNISWNDVFISRK